MAIEFVSGFGSATSGSGLSDVWSRITGVVAAEKGRVVAAISYIGNGAIDHLPLKSGDLLVVNGADRALAAGSTNPSALREFMDNGVAMYSSDALHSKVVVTATSAVIGSANASSNSAWRLSEAIVLTDDEAVIRDSKAYVRDLAKQAELIDDAWLMDADEKFRSGYYGRRGNQAPPSTGPDSGLDEDSRLWIGRVTEEASDGQQEAANGRPFIGLEPDDLDTQIGDLMMIVETVGDLKIHGEIRRVVAFDGEGEDRVAVFSGRPWRPDKRRFPNVPEMKRQLDDHGGEWMLVEGREEIEMLNPINT